jgi:hypothetical protein
MLENHDKVRRVYDHYEKKLEFLVREKENKIEKGNLSERSNFNKKQERVLF